MQSQDKMKSAFRVRSVPCVRKHLEIASNNFKTSSAKAAELHSPGRHVYKTEDGMIIVLENNNLFYVRHNIILAKAGDVFYMPRKIPADFKIEAERTISAEELSAIEAMSE